MVFATLLLFVVNGAKASPKGPEPEGILAGSVLIHPGAKLDIGFNSNKGHGSGDAQADGYLDAGVSLRAKLKNHPDHDWDAKTSFNWMQFFGAGDAYADYGWSVRLATNADLFKTRILRIAPLLSYSYVDQPEDENLRQDHKNHYLAGGANFTIQPGEGKIFSQKIGYTLNSFIYPSHSELTYLDHRFELLTKWNFLPVSSLTLLLDQRIIHYVGADSAGSDRNALGTPFRVKAGLNGLLLSSLSYSLGLGYSYALYHGSYKEHMFIMNADLGYEFTKDMRLSVGYKKDHENSSSGPFYKFHRIKLGYDALFIQRLSLSLAFTTSIIHFQPDQRRDLLFGISSNLYYHFFAGLKLGIDYKMRINRSEADLGSYMQHVVGLSFAYEY
jgi:hypothetical protein